MIDLLIFVVCVIAITGAVAIGIFAIGAALLSSDISQQLERTSTTSSASRSAEEAVHPCAADSRARGDAGDVNP